MTVQTIPARIVIRRDAAAAWTAANPVLLNGEWGFETDTRKLKIGNGTTAWSSLEYYSTGGVAGAAAAYVHNQPSAAATWTIAHNLGFKPAVELLNSGSQEIEADVVHQSINVCLVYFTTPTAGFARLN